MSNESISILPEKHKYTKCERNFKVFRFPKLIHVSQIRKHEWVTFHWIVSFLKQSSFESLQIPLIIRLVRAKEASFFSLNRI